MNSLCRICGHENENNIKIFDESGKTLRKRISEFLPFINVDKKEHYPKQVCQECVSLVDASGGLYEIAKEGQILLDTKIQQIRHTQVQTAVERQKTPAHNRTQPMPAPIPTIVGSLNNRRRVGGDRMCKYCHESFPNSIIDHHIILHMRYKLITCKECYKNFRSVDALGRHRCATVRPQPPPPPPPPLIDLDTDSDDEPICI